MVKCPQVSTLLGHLDPTRPFSFCSGHMPIPYLQTERPMLMAAFDEMHLKYLN